MYKFDRNSAIIFVDCQHDFIEFSNGALPVPNTDSEYTHIMNMFVNRLSRNPNVYTIATIDFHPPNHVSFKSQGGRWPDHCIKGTAGAGLFIDSSKIDLLFTKGTNQNVDAYSAFKNNDGTFTELDYIINQLGVTKLYICGLALDICVLETIKDAVSMGYEVWSIPVLSRAIDYDKFYKDQIIIDRVKEYKLNIWGS